MCRLSRIEHVRDKNKIFLSNLVFSSKITKAKNELHKIFVFVDETFVFEQSFEILLKRRNRFNKVLRKLQTLIKKRLFQSFAHIDLHDMCFVLHRS